MKSELGSRSKGCAEKFHLLIGDAARNLDTTSMTMLPSTPNLARKVRVGSRKKITLDDTQI